jgi:hypothetical protein
MLDHPLYVTFGLSFLIAIIRVIFFERSFAIFLAQLFNFPYWAVIFTFLFFKVLRNVRDSRAYRLLHTIYHEDGPRRARRYWQPTQQTDEFGLT